MAIIRNPFLSKATRIDSSDGEFLRWFGPAILGQINFDRIWDVPFLIRGAPGTGKTSLLRLFTPGALKELHIARKDEKLRDLAGKLLKQKILSEQGLRCLGVLVQCTESFALLQEMENDNPTKEKLFFCLLNANIILEALRGIAKVRGWSFPGDLEKIAIKGKPSATMPDVANGLELHGWAKKTIRSIGGVLDSFGSQEAGEMLCTEAFASLDILKVLQVEGKPASNRYLVMLDDIHLLSGIQRKQLTNRVVNKRFPGVWLAERLQALGMDELLSEGSLEGRDYEQVDLEFTDKDKLHLRLKHYEDIASRRIESIREIRGHGFKSLDVEVEAYPRDFPTLDSTMETIRTRVEQLPEWVRRSKHGTVPAITQEESPLDYLVKWKAHEIMLQRELGKASQRQGSLFGDQAFSEPQDAEGAVDIGSDVKSASRVMLFHEFKVPLYFGSEVVLNMSSANVAQFLAVCTPIFEEIISAVVLGKTRQLSPKRQHKLISDYAVQRWKGLSQSVPHAEDVKRFLTAIGKYCQQETLRKSAPYAPGSTGLGLDAGEFECLKPGHQRSVSGQFPRLLTTLRLCLVHNLLQIRGVTQGSKGRQRKILYLNRWLCVKFGLPLQYGGWRSTNISALASAVESGVFTRERQVRLR